MLDTKRTPLCLWVVLLLSQAIACSSPLHGSEQQEPSETPPSTAPQSPSGKWNYRAERQTTYLERLDDALHVTCLSKAGNFDGSRWGRSPVLVSPDGRYRAYAESEAIAFIPSPGEDSYAGPLCANTSRLFVQRPEARDYTLMFQQEAAANDLGNGIRVVDWSPDSRFLLVQVNRWQYESDAAGFDLLLIDPFFGTVRKPDHNRLFSERFQKECFMWVNALGFTEDDKIVLEASDFWPSEEPYGTPEQACVKKRSIWLLKISHPNTLSLLPGGYKTKRYGRPEPKIAKD